MRQLDVVVITSKLCNLRCTYCYELPLLSDRTTMTLDQLGAMFEHVAAFVEQRKAEVLLRFAWHGGEPLLIKPDFYWRAFERQQQAFAASGQVKLVNHVQTNLTMLDQERLELLSSGFDQVGVSLDLTSGLRVNVAGRDQEHRTLANLDTVLASGLRPGGITVLSRANSRDVRQIYEFYRNRGMDFRLLPVHDSMQNPNHSTTLSFSEVLRSLCQLCDLWLVDAPAIRVEPIQQMIDVIVGVPSGFIELTPYAPELWQSVIIVDTDGGVYSDGELLDQENVMGNLFRQDWARYSEAMCSVNGRRSLRPILKAVATTVVTLADTAMARISQRDTRACMSSCPTVCAAAPLPARCSTTCIVGSSKRAFSKSPVFCRTRTVGPGLTPF